MDALAVIETDPETLASVVETAALYDGSPDDHQEMFVRITEDRLETPASGAGARQASYCTLTAGRFDRLDVPSAASVDAMFDIDTLLGWLEWFDAGTLTARFEGQAGITSTLVLQQGDTEVRIDCVDDPAVLNSVETYLPDRFEDTAFLDEDGNAMPTTVETTAAQLRRLVRAIDLADAPEEYPLVIREGELRLDIEGESGSVSAPLEANIDGPAVTNHYGPGFERVVSGIEGPVTLQTGPGEVVAFVQDTDTYTLRFVVAHE